ncbi:hypothetical protein PTSG_05509 [Salpingoeca rosetta]|uniref:Glycerophosphocholine acyltransferase 1 n=1 Tax=Salpingoeca rosetta (strain ATCC 50818 / BSB-021) TaxID=946362 RepID=F2UBE9_SALR5|nr:uncharacterized protein PTSG_05509 [Salpingoeca rosetta]EGD73815.1 hypothetical protein PTSG_05509 [Salpingoeca rosetta]|eukprot:XP_004993378.1 hypothetical protein PTSG_05509 [Salpingoeca rosetta]
MMDDREEEEFEGEEGARRFLSTLQTLLDDFNNEMASSDEEEEGEVEDDVGEDGRKPETRVRKLGKRAKALKKKIKETKDRLKTIKGKMDQKVTAMRRKVITGSSDKRVRDFLKEVPVVKTIDKVSFTLGVLLLLLVEYMVLEHPKVFGYFYCMLLVPLLLSRWNLYVKEKFQYFLLDFCYFLNLSCMICVFYPNVLDGALIRCCFVLANGPVGWAIVAWRNSLVFHSLEKLTTVYIHALPTLLTFCWRWLPDNDDHRRALCGDQDEPCDFSFAQWWAYPLAFYLSWQAFYLLMTEVLHREKLESDETLQTSLRWMARSQTGMVAAARQLFVRVGVMEQQEQFDHTSWKTKWIFITSQLAYTLISMLPTALFFRSYSAHSFFLILAWSICAWNGAGYYISVFSHRYIEKLEKLEKDQHDQEVQQLKALKKEQHTLEQQQHQVHEQQKQAAKARKQKKRQ